MPDERGSRTDAQGHASEKHKEDREEFEEARGK
jgi:hypothetical protein